MTDESTKFYENSVIFKSKTKETYGMLKGGHFHVFNKMNKSQFFVYEPLKEGQRVLNCSFQSGCTSLKFVEEMDDSMFANIDDVVFVDNWVEESVKKGPKGHLVLFNIEGRPKYCYIPLFDERTDTYTLSEVRHQFSQNF